MKFRPFALAAAGCLLAAPSFAGSSFSISIGIPAIRCYPPTPVVYYPPIYRCEPVYRPVYYYDYYDYSCYSYPYTTFRYRSYDYRPYYRYYDYRDTRHHDRSDRRSNRDHDRDRDHRGDRHDHDDHDRYDHGNNDRNHRGDRDRSHVQDSDYRDYRVRGAGDPVLRTVDGYDDEWRYGSSLGQYDTMNYNADRKFDSQRIQVIDSNVSTRHGRNAGNAQTVTHDDSRLIRVYDAQSNYDGTTRTVPSHYLDNQSDSRAYRTSDDSDNRVRIRRLNGDTDTTIPVYRSVPNRSENSSRSSSRGKSRKY